MLNRRFLRIKVLQALYSIESSTEANPDVVKKNLDHNIEGVEDIYLKLLSAVGEIHAFALKKIEDAKNKRMPSEEDLNPNVRFISMPILREIANSKELRSVLEKKKINWIGDDNQQLIRTLFNNISKDELYLEFMAGDYEESDSQFLRALFKNLILNTELMQDYFEEDTIFWQEDLDLAGAMVIKTIKSIEDNIAENKSILVSLYKDKDDEYGFYTDLFYETVKYNKEAIEMITQLSENWELDRIALLDIILMKMAYAELLTFKSIPTKVTLNEYIELAKSYSTPKSGTFVNGILDKAINTLGDRIQKTGRGLIN